MALFTKKDIRSKEIQKIIDELVDNGYKILSDSIYAIILLGDNKVLKFYDKDPSFDLFLNIIDKIPNNLKQFVQKIYGVTNYKGIRVVKIEKLIPLSEDEKAAINKEKI